jgi:hypothetical protein
MPGEGTNLHDWLVRNYNRIYSGIRFLLNATTTTATLVYLLKVPGPNALAVGLFAGTFSGLLQYYVVIFRDFIESDYLAQRLSIPVDFMDTSTIADIKRLYNGALDSIEQFGKFALAELTHHSGSRIVMTVADIPAIEGGFYGNFLNVVKTSLQAAVGGLSVLGLFKDLEIQQRYQGWTDQFREVVQNTTVFLISAAEVAVSALRLVAPSATGVLKLGALEMPYGFAALALVGVGFYAHGFITYWIATH